MEAARQRHLRRVSERQQRRLQRGLLLASHVHQRAFVFAQHHALERARLLKIENTFSGSFWSRHSAKAVASITCRLRDMASSNVMVE